MGKTKKGLHKQVQGMKRKLEELEEKVRKDPLKKNPSIHEELKELKKKMGI